MPNRHFLRSDIFTVAMVYYFYFLCFGSTRNVFNNLWEKEGRGQKIMAYSVLLASKHRKKKLCPIPDAASERV